MKSNTEGLDIGGKPFARNTHLQVHIMIEKLDLVGNAFPN
jgi:hypothetical protein